MSRDDRVRGRHDVERGARISEVTGLDVDDVRRSARKGTIRIYGKRGKIREVGIHPKLRPDLKQWLSERPTWGAGKKRVTSRKRA